MMLSYRPAKPAGIGSLESILGLLTSLKIQVLGEKRKMNDVKILGDIINRLTDVKERNV
jgi:hypothetical protein